MRLLNVFLYEFNHFSKNPAKVITYLIFVFACIYSIYNGFDLQQKQQDTIVSIEQEAQNQVSFIANFFGNIQSQPDALEVLGYIPIYTTKHPSPLLPLGIGQAEQYGFYKKITTWSSTYDNDMVEELANPERLVNGNIDFSFLILFLLPVLLIILTYNIRGFEQDFRFEKLISVQFGSIPKWIFFRFMFYVLLLIVTVLFFIFFVALLNNALFTHFYQIGSLILLLVTYIFSFSFIFYFLILKSHGSSAIAFKMISAWLVLCVIIPGAVHQFVSMTYPVNYMTDYLDANRKETYEVFDMPTDSIYLELIKIYPDLSSTKYAQPNQINAKMIRNTTYAIVNEINKVSIEKIEKQNNSKNELIRASYWFNPIAYMQNKWNSYTETDYYAYRVYRMDVQKYIDQNIERSVFQAWDEIKLTKEMYDDFLKTFNLDFNH